MKIGGIEKTTLIDYPGEIATIIFTQGCNFRCQFCYNPMLVWPESEDSKLKYNPLNNGVDQRDHSEITENDLFAFLKGRKGRVDGVVITGGEPTLHPDLPEFIEKIKTIGYKVKLDTNGTNPEMLTRIVGAPLAGAQEVIISSERAVASPAPTDEKSTSVGASLAGANEFDLTLSSNRAVASPAPTDEKSTSVGASLAGAHFFPSRGVNQEGKVEQECLIDYIAMDIKAPLEKYEQITQVKVNTGNIKKSINLIMNSGLPYEFRTTIPPELLNQEDVKKMGELIRGADKWYLQFFKSDTNLVNRDLENHQAYTTKQMAELVDIAKQYVKFCEARG
ncbi:MAG: radical SAM protein [Sphingobacterium sp.]